jgi:hypothetical protein
VARAEPAHVTLQLVDGVEAPAFDEALGEAQRHRGVVGPGAGGQVERAAADHVRDGFERPRRLELDGRPERVADGEAQQRSAKPISIHALMVALRGGSLGALSP